MPGFTPENSSCRNRTGNGLPELAGGSRLSAHTAEEIICVVSVPASSARDAVAVALAVVADALKTGDPVASPCR